jgi:transposase-like protein
MTVETRSYLRATPEQRVEGRVVALRRIFEQGRPVAEVAREWGVSPRTVYNWRNRAGPDWPSPQAEDRVRETRPAGRKGHLTQDQERGIRDQFKAASELPTLSQAVRMVWTQCSVSYTRSGMFRLLRRIGVIDTPSERTRLDHK